MSSDIETTLIITDGEGDQLKIVRTSEGYYKASVPGTTFVEITKEDADVLYRFLEDG